MTKMCGLGFIILEMFLSQGGCSTIMTIIILFFSRIVGIAIYSRNRIGIDVPTVIRPSSRNFVDFRLTCVK